MVPFGYFSNNSNIQDWKISDGRCRSFFHFRFPINSTNRKTKMARADYSSSFHFVDAERHFMFPVSKCEKQQTVCTWPIHQVIVKWDIENTVYTRTIYHASVEYFGMRKFNFIGMYLRCKSFICPHQLSTCKREMGPIFLEISPS